MFTIKVDPVIYVEVNVILHVFSTYCKMET